MTDEVLMDDDTAIVDLATFARIPEWPPPSPREGVLWRVATHPGIEDTGWLLGEFIAGRSPGWLKARYRKLLVVT